MMDKKIYNERKSATLSLIEKVKASNQEMGKYLGRSIFLDDKNRTIVYTGEKSLLELLMRGKVIDEEDTDRV